MTRAEWFVALGAAVFVLGAVRMLLTPDRMRRVIALNVAGIGALLILIALAAVADPARPDPVLHALALTGIVITISVTGLALVLVRRVERADRADAGEEPADRGRADE